MRQVFQTVVLLAISMPTAFSAAQAAYDLKMVEGVVVTAQAGTLVVRDEKNLAHTHPVDASVQVIVEGKMGRLEDIRTGMKAHVTLDAGDVISVSATKPTRLRGQM